MNKGAIHKQLMILGMVLERPMYGHQLKETIDFHLEVISDLKRANLYYLLDQLVARGHLESRREPTEGSPRDDGKAIERETYYITPEGKAYFQSLLREVLSSFETLEHPVDVAAFFLPHLPTDEAIALIAERRARIAARYEEVLGHRSSSPHVSTLHDITTNHLAAMGVYRYLREHRKPHVEELIEGLRRKRDAMLSALGEAFGPRAQWSRPRGGMYIWVRLREGADTAAVQEKALQAGVSYYNGSLFSPEGKGRNCLRLCFAYPKVEDIHEGVRVLGRFFEREGLL
ncbi:MAG: aminotransferase class I/II-fold pyridoxal phosphate-dependent enzyme [Dehalococcoidia bacterium]|nr:aminotransferase class I/II-fold pyridoxal phosphate-dependent enzyme [Dehalococcoidia bacterium]